MQRIRAVKGMQALVKEEVLEHMQDVDHNNPRWVGLPPTPPRDLIDAYLAEMATAADPEFHVEQLVMVCADLMGAGSDVRDHPLDPPTCETTFKTLTLQSPDHLNHPDVGSAVPGPAP